MSSCFGNNIRLSVFGQSHSAAIGMTLDGIPAGKPIDFDELKAFLARRAPGNSPLSTPRKEADEPEFLSGFAGNITCGAPIAAVIRNTNTISTDYSEFKIHPRPGHADYTASVKYHGAQDHSGGGHFSGRLTAPICIAGGICLQLLENEGIHVFSRIRSIGNICDDTSFEEFLSERLHLHDDQSRDYDFLKNEAKEIRKLLESEPLPVLDHVKSEMMRDLILEYKNKGDSVGGVIECVITGLPAGIGDPMFDGMENRISASVFAIPAVKGIEFGAGFACAAQTGSENNDEFCIENGRVRTVTNNCGGILGGISDGMPIVFRAAFKPTPSIAIQQRSVNLETMTEEQLSIRGRHDPCIVVRALPCIEAAAALAVYDAFPEHRYLNN